MMRRLLLLAFFLVVACSVEVDRYREFHPASAEYRHGLVRELEANDFAFDVTPEGGILYSVDDAAEFERVRADFGFLEEGSSLVVSRPERVVPFSDLLTEYGVSFRTQSTHEGTKFIYPFEDSALATRLYAEVMAREYGQE
jgi:hypothetical protein